MLDMHDMVRVMKLVQAHEDAESVYDKAEAADALCREVRALIEEEAELSGRYAELMERIGEEG